MQREITLPVIDTPPERIAQGLFGRRSASTEIPVSSIPAVNVASVPQRSPLRYPGGKTWWCPIFGIGSLSRAGCS